jgi:hypothetical protein
LEAIELALDIVEIDSFDLGKKKSAENFASFSSTDFGKNVEQKFQNDAQKLIFA